MIKPLRERLQIYFWLFIGSIMMTTVFLVSGYDYRRNKGFFLAEDREPMSFGEALAAFPKEYPYILLALVIVLVLVELIAFIAQLFTRR